MIEKRIRDYLSGEVATPVYMEHQKNDPDEFYIIEKTGSSESNHINRAVVAIQSYADSLYRAAELNETIKTVMTKIIELPDISKCELNTDYNFTDLTKKKYRYQAIFEVVY